MGMGGNVGLSAILGTLDEDVDATSNYSDNEESDNGDILGNRADSGSNNIR